MKDESCKKLTRRNIGAEIIERRSLYSFASLRFLAKSSICGDYNRELAFYEFFLVYSKEGEK
jgi:hypothetical protein